MPRKQSDDYRRGYVAGLEAAARMATKRARWWANDIEASRKEEPYWNDVGWMLRHKAEAVWFSAAYRAEARKAKER